MTGKITSFSCQCRTVVAERADEFAARRLEQIEVARVINMVADGAFGVGDAVCVAEMFASRSWRRVKPCKRELFNRPKPRSSRAATTFLGIKKPKDSTLHNWFLRLCCGVK